MLFNSHVFIFGLLPIGLVVFLAILALGYRRLAIGWLVAVSLFFYGWWNPPYLVLLGISAVFNFTVGRLLSRARDQTPGIARGMLTLGVVSNLAALGWFKYANFFVDTINVSLGQSFHLETIVLPLAISFFTFQQIAYLVDAQRGIAREYDFLDYLLFVTFFPQLIAGPIVHHKEMLPQFEALQIRRKHVEHLAIGATIFFIGLFKKVILADSIAGYATPVFSASEAGLALSFFEAWIGALSYTFQLYFDFSGYSDMAIGIARMFGIRLPLNFHSPYKSENIIEFWRRWHMTLSRFLREYLYFSLGGNRRGPLLRYRNLMLTMILGGLWHGAGWTFVIWGALHGLYLVVNHGFQNLRLTLKPGHQSGVTSRMLARGVTFTSVVVAWVFFRAESVPGAMNLLSSMVGANGFAVPDTAETLVSALPWVDFTFTSQAFFSLEALVSIVGLGLIVTIAPNTQQFMSRFDPAFDTYSGDSPNATSGWMTWEPTVSWAVGCSVLAAIALMVLSRVSEFLYFQF
ncbi:MAG TPA: MBOAT family protein [Myxococcales bacterium]|nr:MBOAT family protein [Myxococcales bacterium]